MLYRYFEPRWFAHWSNWSSTSIRPGHWYCVGISPRSEVRFGSGSDVRPPSADVPFTPESGHFPLSSARRALGNDVDDLKRHHYLAGLIDYLGERGDRAASGLCFRRDGFEHGHAHRQSVARAHRLDPVQFIAARFVWAILEGGELKR